MTFGIQLNGSGSAKDADGERAVIKAVNKALYELSKQFPENFSLQGNFSGTHVTSAVLSASAGSDTPAGKNGDEVKPNLTAKEAGLKEPVGVGQPADTASTARPDNVSEGGSPTASGPSSTASSTSTAPGKKTFKHG